MDGALSLFGGIAGVGVFAAGIGVAYAQFKTGASGIKDGLIKDLKETVANGEKKVEQLAAEKTTLITSHQSQLTELNGRIGKLEGLAEANEKKAQEYLSILQGRSPDQEEFLKFIGTVAKEATQYMSVTSEMLNEILENSRLAKSPIPGKKTTRQKTKTVQQGEVITETK